MGLGMLPARSLLLPAPWVPKAPQVLLQSWGTPEVLGAAGGFPQR